MYGLKRMLEIKAEKEAKKAEKERLKKEKEAEKLKIKKEARKKKLKSAQNKRCYNRRRKKVLKEREKLGDEYAFYSIYITKNNKRIKRVGAARWKTDAYKLFNKAIEENETEVKFPMKYVADGEGYKKNKVKYEIIMVKKVNEEDEKVAQFKNENGKYIDNVIIDSISHIIEAKHDWLIEESFFVYGYHPLRDRKNYDFILNELILKDNISKENFKSITTMDNKVFIDHIGDFDFIMCKTKAEAKRLYNKIESDIQLTKQKKYIYFLGDIKGSAKKKTIIEKMMEKTGWKEEACTKPNY